MSATARQAKCKDRVRREYRETIKIVRRLWALKCSGNETGDPDYGTFDEYGLCFGYCPAGTWTDQREPFFRWQLSTGGPGDEFRFYCGRDGAPYRVEYWFLDWFDGAKVTLSGADEALMLEIWDDWNECGVPDAAVAQANR